MDAPTIVLVMFHSSTSVWFIWEPQDEVDVYEFTYQYNIKESEQVYCNVSDPVTVTINGTIQYLLTGMEEYSVYTVSIVAVVIGEEQAAEARSSSTVREVTTIQAGTHDIAKNNFKVLVCLYTRLIDKSNLKVLVRLYVQLMIIANSYLKVLVCSYTQLRVLDLKDSELLLQLGQSLWSGTLWTVSIVTVT